MLCVVDLFFPVVFSPALTFGDGHSRGYLSLAAEHHWLQGQSLQRGQRRGIRRQEGVFDMMISLDIYNITKFEL